MIAADPVDRAVLRARRRAQIDDDAPPAQIAQHEGEPEARGEVGALRRARARGAPARAGRRWAARRRPPSRHDDGSDAAADTGLAGDPVAARRIDAQLDRLAVGEHHA